jgi:hypothetical protein
MRTPAQLRRDGWKALSDQLGSADALRFLAEYSNGKGNYTRDRKQWTSRVTSDELFAALPPRHKRTSKRSQGNQRKLPTR